MSTTTDTTNPLPLYVRLGTEKGICIARDGNGYYRHAGSWRVNARIREDGKIVSVSKMKSLNGIELVPCSKEEHDECNEGYLPGQKRIEKDR